MKVKANEPAVLVSFPGIDHPVWVAARLLRVRVMNDSVPNSLGSVDKIQPADRIRMIEEFWSSLGQQPFGSLQLRARDGFWRPSADRVISVSMPRLEFGKGHILTPPSQFSLEEYRENYRKRIELLDREGAFHLPPSTPRILHYAYPTRMDSAMPKQLAGDVADLVSKWSGIPFQVSPAVYNAVAEVATQLTSVNAAGAVLFILDQEPATYYEAAFQLPGWRLKRVTEASLRQYYGYLRAGAWDPKTKQSTLRMGLQKWNQYVRMNSYDLFQQMDGIPYRVPSLGDFEAVLAIDVGYDRRYVAVSLLVARDNRLNPSFRIVTDVHPKTDFKLETINPKILADMVVQLFSKIFRGKCDSLRSLLVLRDGEYRGQEENGLSEGIRRLKEKIFLTMDAATTLAELHKSTRKSIRLWDRGPRGDISNVLEGAAIVIAPDLAVVATTGRATLHQGTAEPLLVSCGESKTDLQRVIQAIVTGAQLNWASPGVAQRLPLVFKRTDEELAIRAAQEIRKIA